MPKFEDPRLAALNEESCLQDNGMREALIRSLEPSEVARAAYKVSMHIWVEAVLTDRALLIIKGAVRAKVTRMPVPLDIIREPHGTKQGVRVRTPQGAKTLWGSKLDPDVNLLLAHKAHPEALQGLFGHPMKTDVGLAAPERVYSRQSTFAQSSSKPDPDRRVQLGESGPPRVSTAVAGTPLSLDVIRAEIDHVISCNYYAGVIGLAGQVRPNDWSDTTHDGTPLRIRQAGSVVAVRQALTQHHPGEWMVIVTDRSDDELGAGALGHLIGHRVRHADPWKAVRLRFHASRIDTALVREGNRALAEALLASAPSEGWPPPPAGTLTRSHALRAVAAYHLRFSPKVSDAVSVLQWCNEPEAVTALADLRSTHGDELTNAALDWMADTTGAAGPAVRIMLSYELTDVVPRGLVMHMVTAPDPIDNSSDRDAVEVSLASVNDRWGGSLPSAEALQALGVAAVTLTADLIDGDELSVVDRVLQRAEAILATETNAQAPALHSQVLVSGMHRRLGASLRTVVTAVQHRRSEEERLSDVTLAAATRPNESPIITGFAGDSRPVQSLGYLRPNEATPLRPPHTPAQWGPDMSAAPEATAQAPTRRATGGLNDGLVTPQDPSRFDDVYIEPYGTPNPRIGRKREVRGLGYAVVASKVFAEQKSLAPRISIDDERVADLVDGLHNARDQRLPLRTAATLLEVTERRARGAVTQVQTLINVEGYAVIKFDVAAGSVLLDTALMRQQFEIP